MTEDKQKGNEDKELDDFAKEIGKAKTMTGDLDLSGKPKKAEEEANLITEKMIKKVTYLIHKLAERQGTDFKEIQKKCKKLFGYENLAKVTFEEGHKIIDKLIELTGGEEPPPEQGRRAVDSKSSPTEVKSDIVILSKEKPAIINAEERKELETEIGKLAAKLQICVRKSHEIVEEEIGKENITEGTRATLVKSFAATLFIEASRRGVGR